MLTALHIRNVVLIDALSLDCAKGLTTLTGETGAGKSILLDSLGLALGARAEAGLIRKGTDQASVTAEFHVPEKHPVLDLLKEQGLASERDLIFRRVLTPDGRSRAFINDEPVSVALLKQAGERLIDIHGQFETYGLLDPAAHRHILDDYAGVAKQLVKTRDTWRAYQDAVKKRDDAKDAAAKAAAQEEYLRHALDDLEKLNPLKGEEQELLSIRQKIQQRDYLLQSLSSTEDALTGKEGAEQSLASAWRVLHRAADKWGDRIQPVLDALDRASTAVQEALQALSGLSADLDVSDHNVDSLEDRLYELRAAARKHNCLVDDLQDMRDTLRNQLALIDHQGNILAELDRAVAQTQKEYVSAAETLHDMRVKAGAALDKKVNKELPDLKLDKAKFSTRIQKLEDPAQWGATGMDTIQFVVSTNPNSDPGPLNKIASGGEMARFMLALKVVLAESADHPQTYVFDEIDTGIGGATASAVGERLAMLAKQHQVLVVTHSPQVAARAHYHWTVSKSAPKGEPIITRVIPLMKNQERREEIARMLSGATITEEARAAASRLLESSAA